MGARFMVVKAEGVLRGGSVELQTPVTAFPDGSLVTVELRPRELPLAEKRRLALALAGSWAGDASLGPIFDEIDRQRHANQGRRVNLDDPS
jgi:hypothetical protein